MECGLLCQQASCMSMVYEATGRICHLHNRIITNTSDCSWRPNTSYYTVVSGVANGYDCDIITDSCLKKLPSAMSWSDGSVQCAAEGAVLLHIDSVSKQQAVQHYMIERGYSTVWLGINDIAKEGDWRTEHGSDSPGYFNFSPGQPDDFTNQDCAILKIYYGYQWEDVWCWSTNTVVCEIAKAL
ncbi:perlucin-like protein [Argopecten irradians]|uniref:perlucin-like protein n=1 Tax=Argopecten irradians TaxID=31199 RepID=UPI003721FEE7